MRLHLKLRSPELVSMGERFETGFDRGLPSPGSLGISFCVHLAVVGVLASISFPAPPPPDDHQKIYLPTEVKIGDRLYYVTRIPPHHLTSVGEPPSRPAAPGRRARQARSKAVGKAKPVEAAENRPAPRQFVPPPELKPDPVAKQTLIQPDSPPDLRPPDPMLPSFQIWAVAPKLPKPFVAPGRVTPVIDAPKPIAPPTLDLVHAAPAPVKQMAMLTLPPIPAPVEPPPNIPPPDLPAQLSSGDPLAVLSISDLPPVPAGVLNVPPGNLVAPAREGTGSGVGPKPAGDGKTTSVGTSKGRGNSAGTNGAPGSNAAVSAAPTAGLAAANGVGTASSASKVGTTGGASNKSSSTNSSIGVLGAAASASASTSTGPAGAVILHPANGNFDAMVVQASPLDLFPETRGLLSGRPIYTVYVAVDAAKEWALYYCVPGQGMGPAATSAVVELTPGAPVQAPYPTRIVRPAVKLPSYQKYVLIHGFVSQKGRFQDVRVVNPGEPKVDEAVVAALGGWEFRAAAKDGVPISVEFLLAIPNAGL